MSAEANFHALNLELPPAPKAMGLYRPIVRVDKLAYLSGHGPLQMDGKLVCGIVGKDLDLAAGQLAARQTGLTVLATLREYLGSLDRVTRW